MATRSSERIRQRQSRLDQQDGTAAFRQSRSLEQDYEQDEDAKTETAQLSGRLPSLLPPGRPSSRVINGYSSRDAPLKSGKEQSESSSPAAAVGGLTGFPVDGTEPHQPPLRRTQPLQNLNANDSMGMSSPTPRLSLIKRNNTMPTAAHRSHDNPFPSRPQGFSSYPATTYVQTQPTLAVSPSALSGYHAYHAQNHGSHAFFPSSSLGPHHGLYPARQGAPSPNGDAYFNHLGPAQYISMFHRYNPTTESYTPNAASFNYPSNGFGTGDRGPSHGFPSLNLSQTLNSHTFQDFPNGYHGDGSASRDSPQTFDS